LDAIVGEHGLDPVGYGGDKDTPSKAGTKQLVFPETQERAFAYVVTDKS
jgi:hypothetical protein